MEIRVRVHSLLRIQLRKICRNSHEYRTCLARVAAQARAVVARHGAEITYAAVHPLRAPPDDGGCAMSAFRSRHGVVLVDVDPLGTAIGVAVIRARAARGTPVAARTRGV